MLFAVALLGPIAVALIILLIPVVFPNTLLVVALLGPIPIILITVLIPVVVLTTLVSMRDRFTWVPIAFAIPIWLVCLGPLILLPEENAGGPFDGMTGIARSVPCLIAVTTWLGILAASIFRLYWRRALSWILAGAVAHGIAYIPIYYRQDILIQLATWSIERELAHGESSATPKTITRTLDLYPETWSILVYDETDTEASHDGRDSWSYTNYNLSNLGCPVAARRVAPHFIVESFDCRGKV